MSIWRGFQLTDPPMRDDPGMERAAPNWHAIALLRAKLHDKYQWARDMGVTEGDAYTELVADVIAEFQARAKLPVLTDDDGHGIADLATRTRLGSYPPPPPPRHALLTFAGTWAPPGVGYPSDVAQACGDVVEEIPVQAPWSFGPMPPGDPMSPSYVESVDIAVAWASRWLDDNPDRTFLLGGYSQGGEAASRVYLELLPGGSLERHMDRFVAGYCLGNPCRSMDGHTFYGDPDPTPDYGISTVHLPDGMDWNWINLANKGDVYTSTPGGHTGEIMRKAYTLGVGLQLHDFASFAADFGDNIWQLVESAAEDIPAALDAAGRGIGFLMTNPPTAPHITYEIAECLPGTTYVDLACQHVRDWAGRVPVDGGDTATAA